MFTLLITLLLAGTTLALPTDTTTTSAEPCIDRSSQHTVWKIEQFDFHSEYIFTTPSHQNSWGYVNFTLSHPALSYKAQCLASSNQLNDFFYGTDIWPCEVPKIPEAGAASFTFDRASGELKIIQSWNCVDERARFTAEGGARLSLECQDSTWKNPEFPKGDIFSRRDVVCEKTDVDANIEQLTGVRR